MSLLQFLKGIESVQKMIDWLCHTSYISKSALKFQVFKSLLIHILLFLCANYLHGYNKLYKLVGAVCYVTNCIMISVVS